MGLPGNPISPWVYQASDYQGNVIRVTAVFISTSPFTLTSVTTFRDAACVYKNVYFGLGTDGTPDTSSKAFGGVPSGTTTVGASTLNALGFTTILNVLAGQVTAGP